MMAFLPKATDKVAWRGVWLDRRSASSLNAAEKLVRKRTGNKRITFSPSQGGWSWASASAGVHGRAAAVDLRVGAWDVGTRSAVVKALRDCGWAAWNRTSSDGFDPHIHGICIPPAGCKDVRLLAAPGGLAQIVSYDAGRNGLANNGTDREKYRPNPKVRWSWILQRAVAR
jgi:hypothetical protein